MTISGVEIVCSSFFSTHYASPSDALAERMRPAIGPAFSLLLGRSRRFTSLASQLHMEVSGAVVDRVEPRMAGVFATCHGEIQTAAHLMADVFASAVVSSARFALSVHNTPAGLFSVATECPEPSTTVTGTNAVAAGWLEAVLTALDSGRATLLSIADEPVPELFRAPGTAAGVAAAFVVAPASSVGRRVELSIAPSPSSGDVVPDTLHTLARITSAAIESRPDAIPLGPIRPGYLLELRLVDP